MTVIYDQIGLKHNRIKLQSNEVKILFDFFDRSREGLTKYKDFMSALRGYMSDYRRSAVEKLYEKLVYLSGKKSLTFEDIKRVYRMDHFGNPERSATEQTAEDFIELLSYHQTLWVGLNH